MDLSEGENMAINLEDAQILLKEHHLLKEQFAGQKVILNMSRMIRDRLSRIPCSFVRETLKRIS